MDELRRGEAQEPERLSDGPSSGTVAAGSERVESSTESHDENQELNGEVEGRSVLTFHRTGKYIVAKCPI